MTNLMPHEEKKNILSIGELLWDFFPSAKHPGGAPANVTFHANQLGLKGTICSRVGSDSLGKELVETLKGQGLSTDLIQTDKHKPTGTVTVDVTNIAEPLFTIDENAAWDEIEWTAELEAEIKKASAICFGTLAQRSQKSRETIWKCLEQAGDALVVYDVNLRQQFYKKEWIEFSLKHANLVKLNTVEVATLASMFDIDATTFIKFAKNLIALFNLKAVCITRGNRGCIAITSDQAIDMPGVQKQIVDAVGAGDAFTAAFIYTMLNKWPLMKAADFANRIGALATTKPGAMPILRAEYAEIEAELLEDTER